MMTEQNSRVPAHDAMNPQTGTLPGGIAVYSSAQLFNGATEICIDHDGTIYRLKITRQGKLILNK